VFVLASIVSYNVRRAKNEEQTKKKTEKNKAEKKKAKNRVNHKCDREEAYQSDSVALDENAVAPALGHVAALQIHNEPTQA
jgi:hypothetical protein